MTATSIVQHKNAGIFMFLFWHFSAVTFERRKKTEKNIQLLPSTEYNQ